MKARFKKYNLLFKRPSGTSRGVMREKETWLLILEGDGKLGVGECGLLRGLSVDDRPDYGDTLAWTCANIQMGLPRLLLELQAYPSIQFGLEQAFRSLRSNDPFELFPSAFTEKEAPIPINGLIWMGDEAYMLQQVEQKLQEGFRCIKLKIGAIDFERELAILGSIRHRFGPGDIEIRVDANGAFGPQEAMEKLDRLATFGLHSIEQPIRAGQWGEMARLCELSPVPIALDEELIGISDLTEKRDLLRTLKPQYIILKPSLVGGFSGCGAWIELAREQQTGWWITSALESNIGLSAIAQWTYTLQSPMPQGLGTGSLYSNNFESPLQVGGGKLHYRRDKDWQENLIENLCI